MTSRNVLIGGPWMIYDHYLVVRPWEPHFNSTRATVNKVAVLIRLPRVFLEYYNKEALSKRHRHETCPRKVRKQSEADIQGEAANQNHRFEAPTALAKGNTSQVLPVVQPIGSKHVDKRARDKGIALPGNNVQGELPSESGLGGSSMEVTIGPIIMDSIVHGLDETSAMPYDPGDHQIVKGQNVVMEDGLDLDLESPVVCGDVDIALSNEEFVHETQ
ncbi:hypothetical protein K1719_009542 [Acacia pycnantha]|nr:hypothetical protein K1719_009542 [Acacia pycnantha]